MYFKCIPIVIFPIMMWRRGERIIFPTIYHRISFSCKVKKFSNDKCDLYILLASLVSTRTVTVLQQYWHLRGKPQQWRPPSHSPGSHLKPTFLHENIDSIIKLLPLYMERHQMYPFILKKQEFLDPCIKFGTPQKEVKKT